MFDISVVSEFLSKSVIEFFGQTNWLSVALIWLIAQILNVDSIAKIIVITVNKLPVPWIRKPLLVFLNKLSKALDKEIPDDIKG